MATPMIQQYLAIKAEHQDAILFFRMGDFYEMFFDDAVVASKALEITLTARSKDTNKIPMCGIPHHASRGYVAKLVKHGFKVAICEQVGDPKLSKGPVKREVTHVVTPGVNLDPEQLTPKEDHNLIAIAACAERYALVLVDASTGRFSGTSFGEIGACLSELVRLNPREVLVVADSEVAVEVETLRCGFINHLAADSFAVDSEKLTAYEIGADSHQSLCMAASAIMRYLERNQPASLAGLGRFEHYDSLEFMALEASTWRNLEIDRTLIEGEKRGSLLHLLDQTETAMGGRLLRRWLAYPLLKPAAIQSRVQLVDGFRRRASVRRELRQHLSDVYDLERLAGRITSELAHPREIGALRRSILQLPDIISVLTAAEEQLFQRHAASIDPLLDIAELIVDALAEDPPMVLKNGGVIRYGFDAELDELIDLCRDGKDWLLRYEAGERVKTGIGSLKVRFNKVFGYYLEVTKSNLGLVPETYIRKQTLINCERYITEQLKEYEDKVLSAEERRVALESELFSQLRTVLVQHATRIKETAGKIARLDVLSTFAEIAYRYDYCRPEIDMSRRLDICKGRHPVIENLLKDEPFIPNDTVLDSQSDQLMIITGPNMAGKSTVMRQVALIVLMAQVGSFVPADTASIGVVDRIFTRVGASDNLSRGHSTFMVEMMETASIVRNATSRSLIIVDEIGRGTSTYDGLSIAWAVAEAIHDQIGARCMFATHYHEMVDLAVTKSRVRNMSIAVKEWNDDIIFLRQLIEGGVSRSYGIQVAKLAGMPKDIVRRAKQILRNLEANDVDKVGTPRLIGGTNTAEPERPGQLRLFSAPAKTDRASCRTTALLAGIDLNATTPLDALQLLFQLKETLDS